MQLFNMLVLLCVASICAGQSVRVKMDEQPKYYPMVGRSVGELYHIGSAQAKRSQLFKSIIFPENFTANDSALALAYFTGNKGKTDPVRYVLIGNYTSPNFFLFCDRNGNLDFTDDGPLVKSPADSTATIYFSRAGASGAHYGLRFKKSYNDSLSVVFFEKMVTHSPFIDSEIPLLGAENWFFTHMLNIRSTKIFFEGDSVQMALQDANADGLITVNGTDAFAIADVNVPLDFREHRSGVTLSDSTVFQWRNQNYLLSEIDSLGNYLEFAETDLPNYGPIRLGNRIPNLPLYTLDKETHLLDDILPQKEYTLLYLWGNWCKACHAGAEKLKKAASQNGNRLQVIGVNSGEPKETIRAFTEKYSHTWPQYYITTDFSTYLDAGSYPMYILLDAEGTLLSYEAYPGRLKNLLK